MAQTTNNPKCNFNYANCPFASKPICVTAFIPTKSIMDFGLFSEGGHNTDTTFLFSVGVYYSDGSMLYILNFKNPLKALRYAYTLKERECCHISQNAMELLKSAIKAYKAKGLLPEKQLPESITEPAVDEQKPEPVTEPAVDKHKPKRKKIQSLQKQYQEMKSKHPDAVLLFRVGDFYEVFDDDAEKASDILGITLTSRKSGKITQKLAGFPQDALDTYLPKLIRAGQRVAVCEELRG